MIIKIEEFKNAIIINKHNNTAFDNQLLWYIHDDKGNKYILDMKANKDITNADYFDIIKTKKTKSKIIFEDQFIFDK